MTAQPPIGSQVLIGFADIGDAGRRILLAGLQPGPGLICQAKLPVPLVPGVTARLINFAPVQQPKGAPQITFISIEDPIPDDSSVRAAAALVQLIQHQQPAADVWLATAMCTHSAPAGVTKPFMHLVLGHAVPEQLKELRPLPDKGGNVPVPDAFVAAMLQCFHAIQMPAVVLVTPGHHMQPGVDVSSTSRLSMQELGQALARGAGLHYSQAAVDAWPAVARQTQANQRDDTFLYL